MQLMFDLKKESDSLLKGCVHEISAGIYAV
jgi:hypothetical protein